MAFKDTCDGCGFDRPYLVFARMADLSGFSIIIGHKANSQRNYKLKKLGFFVSWWQFLPIKFGYSCAFLWQRFLIIFQTNDNDRKA
jgi:hypothetical protein